MKLEKVTKTNGKRDKRWYDDACGTAFALELLGERWTILILRELIFGPRRFGELKANLNGISANVLTQRLERMEADGILTRRKLPPPANVQVYELTPWGYEAEPILQVLGRWATRSPGHDPRLPLSAASIMMSFRTMVARDRLGDLKARIGFRIGADGFVMTLDDGAAVVREEPEGVDLLFTGAPEALAGIVYGGRPIADAIAAGDLAVEGDQDLAARFVTLFPLPPKIAS